MEIKNKEKIVEALENDKGCRKEFEEEIMGSMFIGKCGITTTGGKTDLCENCVGNKKKTKRKKRIGIAHNYVEFEEINERGKRKSIQIPIIYMNKVFEFLKESEFCSFNNVYSHSYQHQYNLDVELWCQDKGNFKLKPKTKRRIVIDKIEVKEIK